MRRWRQRLEWCSYKPRNAHEKLEEVRNKVAPWAFRETALWHLVFGLQASEGWEYTSVVLSHQCMIICYSKGNEHRYLFLTVLFVKFQMCTHTHTDAYIQVKLLQFSSSKYSDLIQLLPRASDFSCSLEHGRGNKHLPRSHWLGRRGRGRASSHRTNWPAKSNGTGGGHHLSPGTPLVFHRERIDAMLPNSAPSFHFAPNSEHMSLVDGFWAPDTRFYVPNFLDLELKVQTLLIPAPI